MAVSMDRRKKIMRDDKLKVEPNMLSSSAFRFFLLSSFPDFSFCCRVAHKELYKRRHEKQTDRALSAPS